MLIFIGVSIATTLVLRFFVIPKLRSRMERSDFVQVDAPKLFTGIPSAQPIKWEVFDDAVPRPTSFVGHSPTGVTVIYVPHYSGPDKFGASIGNNQVYIDIDFTPTAIKIWGPLDLKDEMAHLADEIMCALEKCQEFEAGIETLPPEVQDTFKRILQRGENPSN